MEAHTRETQGIEAESVSRAMSKVKKKKAPGLDSLSGGVVKEAFRVIPAYFQTMYSKCFSTGLLPRDWKKSEVVIILKADDRPVNAPSSYRPICLLPALSKVLEGIMIDRLREDRQESRISQEDAGARVVAYADDLLILVEGGSRAILERKGNEWLSLVNEWCDRVGLEVSASKSTCMMCKGRFSAGRPPIIKCRGRKLPYSLQVRYLGITVGEGLNFLPHFRELRERMFRLAGKMGRVLRSERRACKKVLDVWWGGVFSATAMYGCAVWMSDMAKVASVSALGSCKRAALYGCLPFCRTVSTAAMEMIGGYLPWRFQAVEFGLLYMLKRRIYLYFYLYLFIFIYTPLLLFVIIYFVLWFGRL